MVYSRWKRWLCALGLAVVHGTGLAQDVAQIPVEAFFKPAQLRGAALSPSGRWLAALSSQGKGPVGFVMLDLDGKEPSRFIGASDRDDVVWFRWVSEDWLVFRVDDPNDRSYRGLGSGLMSMRRDGQESRMLIARDWETVDPFRRRRALEPNHYFLGLGAPGTQQVVIAEIHFDATNQVSHATPKSLDVATGALRTLVSDDAPRARGWWLDAKGRPRVAQSVQAGIMTTHWADSAGKWQVIQTSPVFNQGFVPEYVDGEDALVVDAANEEGSLELRPFDFKTGKPGSAVLLATPGFSSSVGVIRDRDNDRILGLELDVDTRVQHWLSPVMAQLQARVDAKLPGRVNRLFCRQCENPQRVLVESYSDVDPGMLVLLRPQEDKWQMLGKLRPEVDPARMARMEFHRIKARDGVDLPVWVTRPRGPSDKAAPAVVLVHGGPWVRGAIWSWNAEAQFLASRGYVVVQPEFRGSTGYGSRHFRAGFRQWGQAMQDDVTDALQFAISRGWVDRSRVCIMGASYGGYATLMGLAKDPDQYRCGVAFAAVADPRFMFDFHWNDVSSEAKSYSLPVLLGDRKADDAMFAANSPLEQASRIKAPVLLVHGGQDRRVPMQNAERMRAALEARGKVVEWVTYPDEGHGFQYLQNELDYYRRVEAFLAKHLKP